MSKLLRMFSLSFFCLLFILTMTTSFSPNLSAYVISVSGGNSTAPFESLLPIRSSLESEKEAWWSNIKPEPVDKTVMTWAYRPQSLDAVPPGVNVLAPTWFYVEADANGSPVLHTLPEMGRSVNFDQYVTTAHDGGSEVWGTVVSFNASLTDALLHNDPAKQSFITRVAELVHDYALDGINLDFEYFDPAYTDDYTQFVADCVAAWDVLDITTSVDVSVHSYVPEPNNWYQSYNRGELAKVVDYIGLMSYDQHYSTSPVAGPVAGMDWVESRLLRLLEEVPSDQILLGVPFYGRDFPALNDGLKTPAWPDTSSVKTIYKSDVDSLLANDLFSRQSGDYKVVEWVVKNEWQPEIGVYYIEFIDQNNIVHQIWYDEETSLANRADLVQKYNLSGLAAWNQGQGRDSFWLAINDALTR
jgi:spore germination protein YaaH